MMVAGAEPPVALISSRRLVGWHMRVFVTGARGRLDAVSPWVGRDGAAPGERGGRRVMKSHRCFVTGGPSTIGSPILDGNVHIRVDHGKRPGRHAFHSDGTVAIVGCG